MNLQFTTSGHYIAKTVDNFTKEEIIVLVINNEHLVKIKLHINYNCSLVMQEVIKSLIWLKMLAQKINNCVRHGEIKENCEDINNQN